MIEPEENPYAAPKADDVVVGGGEATGGLSRLGDVLIAPPDAVLPEICVKCGSRTGLTRRQQKFIWHPQWVYFLLLLRVIPYLIAYYLTRKQSRLDFALCDAHLAALKRARWLSVSLAVGLVVAFVAAIVGFVGAGSEFAILIPAVLLASLIALVVVTRLFVRPHQIHTRRITKVQAEYVGMSPAALDLLVPR